ncbi:putative SAP30-binding protein [Helianthus annuus]|uniref:SAP30-binding protein n=1 Tax=Helianthus annuus TaxID=4232 RepID=A0A251TDK7_HELAN|nr:SAP30-binding protein [Helianthus annuus]KAF5784072.1 putative SAP30-binding protein [Helianthus annuus]KAJ0511590.1 putative SAP30-binding protein [Helianthus annuus]KAJ0519263.1 putative SAP30-binding protein [Helianthus annuus]KAJ0691056.1 putative SAP30-binding protein [Helianthus annuus]
MASKKKESEGIALLSMYGDEEDDDMEEDDIDNDNTGNDVVLEENKEQGEVVANMEEYDDELEAVNVNDNDNTTSVSPAQQVVRRKGGLTIVDYGHDEAAMSPEPEEGEIAAAGRVMFGAELQTANGTPQGTTPPNTQSTPPQSSDQSQSDALLNSNRNETERSEPEESVNVTTEDDRSALDKFLPPPPTTKCSDELQEKITKFILLKKKTGRSFNSEVRNRKEYRNPDFLLHAVTYQDIDQIGSCFSKDVFDPHGYDKADYYDEIEADIKREVERKEQEKKKNQKIEFLSGGTQSVVAIPTPKVMPVQAVPPLAGGGSNRVSATGTREGRLNKKSKWDKVDEDRRHPSGQDPISGAGSAFLSAGTGYTAFAQQRRREEERRSTDRK